jgi:cell wall-associated NlpC family hydrolase
MTSSSSAAARIVPLLVAILVGAPVGLLVLVGGSGGIDASAKGALAAGSMCATSGPISGLSDEAAQNARTIAAVGFARAGDQGALETVMIGLAESGLRILGNPRDPSADALPVQGIGTDHDSLGIFQQRPNWGSAQQRLDPAASANLLLDRLLGMNGWKGSDPWAVAQAVQVSAYDGDPRPANHFSTEYGGNYHAQLEVATRIVNAIKADSAKIRCTGTGGSGTGQMPAGPVGPFGLPESYTIPAGTTPAARTAVLAAVAELGRPYVFGAVGPDSFDCSGLMLWAWAKAGVTLPHYTGDQSQAGTATDEQSLAAGDLVLTPGSDGTVANPQHVGMYIGAGLVIEAPQTGDVVKVVTFPSFVSDGVSALRHLA